MRCPTIPLPSNTTRLKKTTRKDAAKNDRINFSTPTPHQAAADALRVLELDVPLDLLGGTGVADGPRETPTPHVHRCKQQEPCPRRRDEKGHRVQRQEQHQEHQVTPAGENQRQLRGSVVFRMRSRFSDADGLVQQKQHKRADVNSNGDGTGGLSTDCERAT